MRATTVAMVCPIHGFIKGSECPHCEKIERVNNVATHDWIKQGDWEHITGTPLKFNSKEELVAACKKHNCIPRAFIKPKSQGSGYEIG